MNDFDNVDFLSLPIEELGEYLVQNEVEDSWKHLSLEYTEEEYDSSSIVDEAKRRCELDLLYTSGSDMIGLESGLERLSYEHADPFLADRNIVQESNCVVDYGVIPHQSKIIQYQSSAGACTNQKADCNDCLKNLSSSKQLHQLQSARCALLPKAPKRSFEAMVECNSEICFPIRSPETLALSKGDKDSWKADNRTNSSQFVPSENSIAEEDRGFRKKSREKIRRQEVKIRFDELIELLGVCPRMHKSSILKEAVLQIKTLKRENRDLQRECQHLKAHYQRMATSMHHNRLGSIPAQAQCFYNPWLTHNDPWQQPFTSSSEVPKMYMPSAQYPPGSNMADAPIQQVSTTSGLTLGKKI